MSTLFVVATPIGNLEDLTPRARQVLSDVDIIAAEDTRHTGLLLSRLSIPGKMLSLHDYNETRATAQLLELLQAGKSVALVSDAGTPLVSDPGYQLVRECHQKGFRVVPVAGPSSVTAALSVAGLPTDRFTFEGFLPTRDKAREDRLRAIRQSPLTHVCLEAPHRILQSIQALVSVLGDEREVSICREMTKTWEQIVTASAGDLLAQLVSGEIPAKGEFVVLVRGSESPARADMETDVLLAALMEEMSPSRAAALAAKVTAGSRAELYARAVELGDP